MNFYLPGLHISQSYLTVIKNRVVTQFDVIPRSRADRLDLRRVPIFHNGVNEIGTIPTSFTALWKVGMGISGFTVGFRSTT